MTIPVQAVLASSLYESRKSAGYDSQGTAIETGYSLIDDNLGGVLNYGRLHCLSGEPGVGKSIFCLSIVVQQLLFHPESEVTIIDATNSFNVPQLFELLRTRSKQIQDEAASGPGTDSRPMLPSMSQEALLACLDKVKVMQVFDFTGIVEALGETRGSFPSCGVDRKQTATIIADSDDESDAESPLDWPATQAATTQVPQGDRQKSATPSKRLILIQGLDRISAPLIRRDYVNGHSSMTSLLRSLSRLALSTRSCILITNSATTPRSIDSNDTPSKGVVDEDQPPQQRADQSPRQRGPVQHYSVFSSNLTAPTHARLMDSHVDLHMLLSKLPESTADAEICYGRGSGGGSLRYRSANVVEVLLDRNGPRTGRWAAYEVADEGTLKPI